MEAEQIEWKKVDGGTVCLKDYEGKVLLIVNTASKCGFTPQYEDLERLYEIYREDGFEILAFPCIQFHQQEPGDNQEIQRFCKINYGITFPVFAKIDVKGEKIHPLYRYLTAQIGFQGLDQEHPISGKLSEILKEDGGGQIGQPEICWNFTKFLLDRKGNVVRRFEPTKEIKEVEEAVKEQLKEIS